MSEKDEKPIPPNVYFRNANFYDSNTRMGMGVEFYETWKRDAWRFPGFPNETRPLQPLTGDEK